MDPLALACLALLGSFEACGPEATEPVESTVTEAGARDGSGRGGAAGTNGAIGRLGGGNTIGGGSGNDAGLVEGGPGGTATLPPLCHVQIQCATPIVDEPKVDCTFQGTDGFGMRMDADHAGVEQRGRSSLAFPKKNYSIELRTALGAERPSPMLGMGKESDWILDGSWVDRSFMRNDLVFWLYRDMGRYAAESRYCTLELDNGYQGIYRFSEKIKRDDDRVALPVDDGSGNTFLIEQDKDGVLHFEIDGSQEQNTWKLDYPKQATASATQVAGVQRWLDGLHEALNGSDPDNAATGVFSYLDLDATVDWILVEEFSKNIDAFSYSLSLARSAGTHANLIPWDMDLAFGQPTTSDATNDTNAVSSTIEIDVPSTPRKYSTLSDRIQTPCSMNWNPSLPLSFQMSQL